MNLQNTSINNRQNTSFKGYTSLVTKEALASAIKTSKNEAPNSTDRIWGNLKSIRDKFQNSTVADALVLMDKDLHGQQRIYVAIAPSQSVKAKHVPGGFNESETFMASESILGSGDELAQKVNEHGDKLEIKYNPKKSRN